MSKHNRRYTIALLVLAFFLLISAVELLFLPHEPSATWMFRLICCIQMLLVGAIAATLALRAWAPAAGRIATVALNIVLLTAIPIGTAIAIYGFCKVDKPEPPVAT
jgi:peptidoglycan/LPS O-acetylase OafA/YrhL